MKLRAWHKTFKNWVYFVVPDSFREGITSSNYEHWCEWTGLKDKNGQEVYDGDFVQRYDEGPYKVYWHQFTACWRMDRHTGIAESDMALACEVVGNIYQNPELATVER